MKNLSEYISEATARVDSLKWKDKEWELIEKIIKHVEDNPKHKEWYHKMYKDADCKKYTYDVFGKGSPMLNGLDSWHRLQKNGQFAYWTPDRCSEFGAGFVPCILYVLNSEMYFHKEDASKDDYTDKDIDLMQSMIDGINDKIPSGELLNRKDLLKIIEPIVDKFDDGKIQPEDKEWDCVCIEFDEFQSWSDCLDKLDKKLKSYKNIVTGDGEFNSIYVDY